MARGAKKFKAQFLGEPEMPEGREPTNTELAVVLNWYNTHNTSKNTAEWTYFWAEQSGEYSKKQISHLKKLPTWKFPVNLNTLCRLLTRGSILAQSSHDYIRKSLDELLKIEIVVEEAKVVYKKTTAQINDIRLDSIMCSIEESVDDWANSEIDVYSILKSSHNPKLMAKSVRDYYDRQLQELKEALAGTDPDLNEAYEYLSKRELKKFHDFIENIVNDADKLLSNQKKRKPRAKKIITAQKQIENIKYLPEYDELKLVSFAPINIIGAQELYIFNTKYREITRYEAIDKDGFKLKGTTLQNFDDTLSEKKKVRKPEEFLPTLETTKIRTAKLFKELKTRASKPNGRINGDCVLLKFYT